MDPIGQTKSVRRYAFVVPRYFKGIAGGAETLAAALAHKLAARGDLVEILTSCAKDNRSWENHFPAGISQEGDLVVRRFPANSRNLDSWIPLQIKISQGFSLTFDDQIEWLEQGVNSDQLYLFLKENSARFDLIFFGPYLFSTTFWGSLIAPEKSVLIPCLHDEAYAYLPVIGSMFRQLRGALFNCAAEQALAHRLFGAIDGGEVGTGFESYPKNEIAHLSPFFEGDFPYLVYLGRKETGKNVQLLLDYFVAAKDQGLLPAELRLVIAGGGDFADLERPQLVDRPDLIDLTDISEFDKKRLLKFAVALCQPSLNESFSIVIMESWLLGVPVLVHASCAVTREHVIESGGGLYFADQVDFVAMVQELLGNKDLADRLGQSGQRYVEKRYCWEAVLDRFDRVVEALLAQSEQGGARDLAMDGVASVR